MTNNFFKRFGAHLLNVFKRLKRNDDSGVLLRISLLVFA